MNWLLSFGRPYLYWAAGIAFALLLGALGVQTVRLAGAKTDLAEAKQAASDENAQRWSAAMAFQKILDKVTADHAAAQQQSEDDYNAQIAKLQTDRARTAADNRRLQHDITTFTAGDRRAGESDADALKRAADRLKVVGAFLAEGTSLLDEGIGIIKQRDVEVARLLDQIRDDRAACAGAAPPGGS